MSNAMATASASNNTTDSDLGLLQESIGCDELSLWKIGKCLNARQAQELGMKLGFEQTELENLYDKVQKSLCSQEEMNFEMLHIWNARQTPDDDPQARLSQILIRYFEISEDRVQEMFTEESLLSTGQKRELTTIHLREIAARVDRTRHIPLVLRLGLTFNDLQLIKHHCGNHLDLSVFKLLIKWQNDLPPGTDQRVTMSNILAASGQNKLAYNIGNNYRGVNCVRKEKSMTFGSRTPYTRDNYCAVDLNVSARDPNQFKQMFSNLSQMVEKCGQKVELSSQGEDSTEELEKIHYQFQEISRFLTRFQEAGTRENKYDLERFGFRLGSIILLVSFHSEEGLKTLREDIESGYLGRRLAKVLMVQESNAPISDDAVLDITLIEETIVQISQQTAESIVDHGAEDASGSEKESSQSHGGVSVDLVEDIAPGYDDLSLESLREYITKLWTLINQKKKASASSRSEAAAASTGQLTNEQLMDIAIAIPVQSFVRFFFSLGFPVDYTYKVLGKWCWSYQSASEQLICEWALKSGSNVDKLRNALRSSELKLLAYQYLPSSSQE